MMVAFTKKQKTGREADGLEEEEFGFTHVTLTTNMRFPNGDTK